MARGDRKQRFSLAVLENALNSKNQEETVHSLRLFICGHMQHRFVLEYTCLFHLVDL